VGTVTKQAGRSPRTRLPAPHALASSSGRSRREHGKAASSKAGRHASSKQSELRRRILVIDDEPSIRLLTRVNLGASGMDVLEAADGETGLALARKERPDLVLLDVMMPGVDGWDVARLLGEDEATKDIPIVFLTARAEQTDRVQGRQAGGIAYLLKPFDPVSLADVIERILERLQRGEREQLRDEMTRPRGRDA
jgi:DNA-binding response OmpR family regulator